LISRTFKRGICKKKKPESCIEGVFSGWGFKREGSTISTQTKKEDHLYFAIDAMAASEVEAGEGDRRLRK